MHSSRRKCDKAEMTCWVVTEGMIGTQNQCVGVAEALGVTPQIKVIGLRQPWRSLSPWLGLECGASFTTPLVPPNALSWPDLLIASGRKAIAAARYIKKQSRGQCFTVFIQDPKCNPKDFDLVAVAHHDQLRGRNVIVTDGAPNRITDEKLDAARQEFAPLFGAMPPPRVAVLIGGNSRTHQLTPAITDKMMRQLTTLDASLMLTTSRRTGAENLKLIQNNLQDSRHYLWDGTGDNPYLGMLSYADYIIVTSDSVSMLSDAATTGKPVYVINLQGGSPRFNRLHGHFQSLGITREFTGNLESWSYPPLNDAQKIADEVKNKLFLTPCS